MKPTTIAAIGLIVVAVALPIGVVGNFVWDVHNARNSLPLRHTEATAAIEWIYGHYAKQQAWPTAEEVATAGVLPKDWQYDVDSSSAVLTLHGSYHLTLSYRFLPPDGAPSRTWVVSWEGDKSQFTADTEYQPLP